MFSRERPAVQYAVFDLKGPTMPPLWTEDASRAIADIARRHGFSDDAGRAMADALQASAGSMAQFYHPDLGGMGQWSRGGMLMIGDMFNNQLKGRIAGLAEEMAEAMGRGAIVERRPAPGESRAGFRDWWPDDLGRPSSTGAQNGRRYAVFPSARRLAVETDGRVTLYDTGDASIGGASQQQGGGSSLSFSTDRGQMGLEQFAVVGAPREIAPEQASSSHQSQSSSEAQSWNGADARHEPPTRSEDADRQATPEPAVPKPVQADASDPIELIRKLATLKDAGVLTEEEFQAKKTELLARI